MFREFRELLCAAMSSTGRGIIIGVAFGKIVTSLVNDIVMHPSGSCSGGRFFQPVHQSLRTALRLAGRSKAAGAPTINYGVFSTSGSTSSLWLCHLLVGAIRQSPEPPA